MEKVSDTLSRKEEFLIDEITEDSFYGNLLLGITSNLTRCNSVKHVRIERHPGATLEEVNIWEDTNDLILPEDLRNFFLSTNGFSLTYKFQYNKTEADDESYYVLGGIEINSLYQMETIATSNVTYSTKAGTKFLALSSKLYVLAQIDDTNCVVLAQPTPSDILGIWLYYKMKKLYLLCTDFVTYFRMALAHLGVPGWQFSVLKASLPEWSAEMLRILAPGIYENKKFEDDKIEQNILDSGIFEIEDSESDN